MGENKVDIKIDEIMGMLPHRYPFLLVDRIVSLKEGETVVGIKNVTINEPFFQGHFPNNPIMPGVLIVEAMAQTSGILVMKTVKAKPGSMGVLFTSIDNVKFKKPVVPGDVLEMHIELLKNKMNIWYISGEAFVDGKKVSQASFSAMIYKK